MKHLLTAVLAAAIALSAAAMTSCTLGENGSETGTTDTTAATKANDEPAAATADQATVAGGDDADILHGKDDQSRIEALIHSERIKNKIAEMKTSAAQSNFALEVTADSNQLVFIYTAQNRISKDAIDPQINRIEQNSASFENLAAYMKNEMAINNATVRVKILSADGNEPLFDKNYNEPKQAAPTDAIATEAATTVVSDDADDGQYEENDRQSDYYDE